MIQLIDKTSNEPCYFSNIVMSGAKEKFWRPKNN